MSTDLDWSCIAFTRTRGWEERDRRDDDFTDFRGLLTWARKQGLVTIDVARRLEERAAAHPREATSVLREAVELRSATYRVLRARARGREPAAGDLTTLNGWVERAGSHRLLARDGDGYRWAWAEGDPPHPHRVLWPVAASAAELLTGDMAARLRACDGDGCGWLFIDESRNRSRRWCDMSDCGNRAKVRRYRTRHADG